LTTGRGALAKPDADACGLDDNDDNDDKRSRTGVARPAPEATADRPPLGRDMAGPCRIDAKRVGGAEGVVLGPPPPRLLAALPRALPPRVVEDVVLEVEAGARGRS
jgi:hypothetical protein